jgi:hypothetical protein
VELSKHHGQTLLMASLRKGQGRSSVSPSPLLLVPRSQRRHLREDFPDLLDFLLVVELAAGLLAALAGRFRQQKPRPK